MPTPIYYPPLDNGLQKTLDSDLSTGVTASLTLNNANRIQNKPGVLVIDRIDTNGALKLAADREYIGYTGVSGSTLTGLSRGLGGSTDQDHSVGAVIEFVPDAVVHQMIADALAALLSGTDISVLKTGLILPSPVLNGSITGTGVKDEDDMASNSATAVPTQQSVKAYVDKPRTTTETSSATPTINTDNTDMHTITALAAAITSMTTNLSGTPVNGQKLIIRIKDDGTARGITWGASFASRGATLPTTTVLGKYQYNGFMWNSTTSTWDCVATINEA